MRSLSDSLPPRGYGIGRRSRVATLTFLSLLAVLLWPTAAVAHPGLIETAPGAGYAVTAAPQAISVTFNEPVTPVEPALTLRLSDGGQVPLVIDVSSDRRSLHGTPDGRLAAGSYLVSYRVVALDGDLVEGTFAFGVATPVAAGSTAGVLSQDDPDQVQPPTALARAMLFLGLALAAGGVVGAGIARRETGALAAVRPLTRLGALLGLTGAAILLLQVASVDPAALPRLLRTSEPARLLAAKATLFAVAFLVARTPRLGALALVPLSAVVLLEGIRAHPGEAVGSFGVLLTVVHLAAAAVWVGGLVHVVRQAIAWRGKSLATWMVVGAYARVAVVLFLVVFATGTLSALLLLPTWNDWTGTTYGQVLLLKLVLLAAAVAAALIARIEHRHGAEQGRDVIDVKVGSPWILGRAARVEAALLAAIVLVTAGLTSATPPRLVSQTALLPAPTGAVLRVAERMNQVTVALVASEGRLEARAYAPGPQESIEYELRLSIDAPAAETEALKLRPCGLGCWSSEVDWVKGTNVVDAEVTATGWEGGRAKIEIRWPPQPANDLLRSVQTLVFAMPVLGYHFTMTLDAQNRVAATRVVTGKHRIERRYQYPETDR